MRLLAAVLALTAVVLLAGCGGSTPSQPSGSTINASSGKVVFFLVNAGTTSHDLIIRDSSGNRVSGAASELVSAGDSFVFTVSNIGAGTYAFFCDQPGHEASGMKGTLTVT
jgi:uncharacterized cupredoxin-like copper-binding protein